MKKGFIKGEALRVLRTNSSKTTFEENILNFKIRLVARGYPVNLIDKHLSEINSTERKSALKQNKKSTKDILPFVTQYEPAVPNIKQISMKNGTSYRNNHYSKKSSKIHLSYLLRKENL